MSVICLKGTAAQHHKYPVPAPENLDLFMLNVSCRLITEDNYYGLGLGTFLAASKAVALASEARRAEIMHQELSR